MRKFKLLAIALILILAVSMFAACSGGIPSSGTYEMTSARKSIVEEKSDGNYSFVSNSEFGTLNATGNIEFEGNKFKITINDITTEYTWENPNSDIKNDDFFKAISDAKYFKVPVNKPGHALNGLNIPGFIWKSLTIVSSEPGSTRPFETKDCIIVAIENLDDHYYYTYEFILN